MSKNDVIEIIKEQVANVLKQPVDTIDEDEKLLRIGVTSIQAIKIINRIRLALEVDINPVAIFEYKTISSFAEYLANVKTEVAA